MDDILTLPGISLWQPWAALVMTGEKVYETRHWNPQSLSRGCSLVIHAAKKFGANEREFCREYPAREALARHGITIDNMPLGVALGIVQLVAVHRIDRAFMYGITEQERSFGNYAPGRYAWEMRVLHTFPTPIPMKGQQSIFNVMLPIEDGDREQLKPAAQPQVVDDRPRQLSLF